MKLLEIACFNLESAVVAGHSGADRIELCDNYNEGGITPAFDLISKVIQSVPVPVNVIIRPRGGNFVYSEKEIAEMKAAILFCKSQKVNGIVLGALNSHHKIDITLCEELITLAGGLPVTFHRAIDQCTDPDVAFQQLIGLGVARVLTSGFHNHALHGVDTLKQLQKKYGQRIVIIPGGGIRSGNIRQLLQTGCSEFHSAALTDKTQKADDAEIKKLKAILLEG